MSLTIHPRDPARKRRPCRQQIPSLEVTEGRLLPAVKLASPPRRIGKGGKTYAERRAVSDAEIERRDAACEPRWMIAAAVNLSESQVYRRLKRLRERKMLYRAAKALMDDEPRYA